MTTAAPRTVRAAVLERSAPGRPVIADVELAPPQAGEVEVAIAAAGGRSRRPVVGAAVRPLPPVPGRPAVAV